MCCLSIYLIKNLKPYIQYILIFKMRKHGTQAYEQQLDFIDKVVLRRKFHYILVVDSFGVSRVVFGRLYRRLLYPEPTLLLGQWFLTWGKFTPGDKFNLPRG